MVHDAIFTASCKTISDKERHVIQPTVAILFIMFLTRGEWIYNYTQQASYLLPS